MYKNNKKFILVKPIQIIYIEKIQLLKKFFLTFKNYELNDSKLKKIYNTAP